VLPVDIRLSAHMSKLRFTSKAYSYVGGVPVFDMADRPISDWNLVFKWLFDKLVAVTALILLSPVMVATAIAIKLESKGPVFFRQKRDGAANQWFEGQALRLEYDEKTETVDLQVQAQVRRTSDGELTDEVSGERIVYTSVTETYAVRQLPGSAAGGDRRGKMVLQPRKDPLLSPASATAANLSQ